MKKKAKLILLPAICAILIPVSAFAAEYKGISLPAYSGNWTSPDKVKSTTDSYFSHASTKVAGDYNYVNVKQTSAVYLDPVTYGVKHREGDGSQNVYWHSSLSGSMAKGQKTNLIVENADFTYVKVEADGTYDLR